MKATTRGRERERDLSRDVYFSDFYFSMPQLCSFAHQLNLIHAMRPTSAIEIGMGNGFVSTYLRRSGLPIVTADINPSLQPDICAPLADVCKHLAQQADLVICCEVLEHMPLAELETNLDYLRDLGARLFMTLPNSFRAWGISGLAFLPKLNGTIFDLVFNIPWKRPLTEAHFWEVDDTPECTRKAIVKHLRHRYTSVRTGRFALNPYHVWFICE